MVTITLKINDKTKVGRLLLDSIKLFASEKKGVEIVKVPNATTRKAIEDVKNGKTVKVKDSAELFKQLGI